MAAPPVSTDVVVVVVSLVADNCKDSQEKFGKLFGKEGEVRIDWLFDRYTFIFSLMRRQRCRA